MLVLTSDSATAPMDERIVFLATTTPATTGLSYEWDFNGDGTTDLVTNAGAGFGDLRDCRDLLGACGHQEPSDQRRGELKRGRYDQAVAFQRRPLIPRSQIGRSVFTARLSAGARKVRLRHGHHQRPVP